MSAPPPEKGNSFDWLWVLALLFAILLMFSMVFFMGMATKKATHVGEPGSFRMGTATGSQTGCPDDSLQKFRKSRALWNAMNANLGVYKAAATENDIPWEMLAALHYREHTFSPSDPNGEGAFQLTTYYDMISAHQKDPRNPLPKYKGKNVTMSDIRDFSMSARLAADILQHKVAKRGGPITPSASDDLVKAAFWGYNGIAYGSADKSPYVMNHFDAEHNNMRISGFVRGIGQISAIDSKDGAFTIYYLLKYLGVYDAQGNLTGFTDCVAPATGTGGTGGTGGAGASATGDKIVQIAKGYIGTSTVAENGDYNVFRCDAPTRSCASFVSTVLKEAGAMDGFYARATDIWNKGGGQTIIDRSGAYDASKLQPGDVVFFGNGSTGVAGSIFNHVGIYIGNDQIVDTSSSQKKVVGPRSIKVHSGGNAFSGAKRFGN